MAVNTYALIALRISLNFVFKLITLKVKIFFNENLGFSHFVTMHSCHKR